MHLRLSPREPRSSRLIPNDFIPRTGNGAQPTSFVQEKGSLENLSKRSTLGRVGDPSPLLPDLLNARQLAGIDEQQEGHGNNEGRAASFLQSGGIGGLYGSSHQSDNVEDGTSYAQDPDGNKKPTNSRGGVVSSPLSAQVSSKASTLWGLNDNNEGKDKANGMASSLLQFTRLRKRIRAWWNEKKAERKRKENLKRARKAAKKQFKEGTSPPPSPTSPSPSPTRPPSPPTSPPPSPANISAPLPPSSPTGSHTRDHLGTTKKPGENEQSTTEEGGDGSTTQDAPLTQQSPSPSQPASDATLERNEQEATHGGGTATGAPSPAPLTQQSPSPSQPASDAPSEHNEQGETHGGGAATGAPSSGTAEDQGHRDTAEGGEGSEEEGEPRYAQDNDNKSGKETETGGSPTSTFPDNNQGSVEKAREEASSPPVSPRPVPAPRRAKVVRFADPPVTVIGQPATAQDETGKAVLETAEPSAPQEPPTPAPRTRPPVPPRGVYNTRF